MKNELNLNEKSLAIISAIQNANSECDVLEAFEQFPLENLKEMMAMIKFIIKKRKFVEEGIERYKVKK